MKFGNIYEMIKRNGISFHIVWLTQDEKFMIWLLENFLYDLFCHLEFEKLYFIFNLYSLRDYIINAEKLNS